MVTRITGVVPRKVDGIRSGEGVSVEIQYNAEHPGLPIVVRALTPHFSASLDAVSAQQGERNRVSSRLVLSRAPGADSNECMVEFVLGQSRPFQVLFSVENA